MPKKKSVLNKKPASKSPGEAAPVRKPNRFYCTRCTRDFPRQKSNFSSTHSPLYKENGGYIPICRHCVDELYTRYLAALGDEREAVRRICMIFDYYYSDKAFDMAMKSPSSNSFITAYITKVNMFQFIDKTYDDTIADDKKKAAEAAEAAAQPAPEPEPAEEPEEIVVSDEVREFWGGWFEPEFYAQLQKRYDHWLSAYDGDITVNEQAVIKQICIAEITINRDAALGKPINAAQDALQRLLGSADLKPVQIKKKTEASDALASSSFGDAIRMYEETRPIPEPDPAFADVDGIGKYIRTWFTGYLAKVLKLKGFDSSECDSEIAKYTVTKPEYNYDDDNAPSFESVFGDKAGGDDE